MAIGTNFYGQGDEINNLLRSQANQSMNTGVSTADLADPFRNERKQYQNSLRSLMSNPGEFSSSPVYKFAYDQGLNALQRKGSVRSGNKLAALMKYGQDAASQLYFPQANLLSTLSGATTGSPAAAGLAYQSGINRAQDQRQVGMASQMYGGGNKAAENATPWWWGGSSTTTSALPTGGGGGGGGGRGGSSYSDDNWNAYMALRQAAVDRENYQGGTGYVSSDYGTYNFGAPVGGDSYYTPSYYTPTYSSGYDPYGLSGYSDYGDWGGDYGGDYSYGGEE